MNALLPTSLPLLKKLHGEAAISQNEATLSRMLDETEAAWYDNAERMKGKEVKYILVTEAPCSGGDTSEYFYIRIFNSFHQKIWKAIFPNEPLPADMETAYQMLADKGFLLVDSIPFSLKYAGKRDKKAYTDLITQSVDVLKEKLNHPALTISPDAIVAFAFKVNAQKLIEATNGVLTLGNGTGLILDESHIAADGSGYTNSALLYKLFGLDGQQ